MEGARYRYLHRMTLVIGRKRSWTRDVFKGPLSLWPSGTLEGCVYSVSQPSEKELAQPLSAVPGNEKFHSRFRFLSFCPVLRWCGAGLAPGAGTLPGGVSWRVLKKKQFWKAVCSVESAQKSPGSGIVVSWSCRKVSVQKDVKTWFRASLFLSLSLFFFCTV